MYKFPYPIALGSGQRLLYRLGSGLGLVLVLVCAYCSACADLCDNGPESLLLAKLLTTSRTYTYGVARLEWARVRRFQKRALAPLKGLVCSENKQSPYSGNFWVGLIGLKFVIQAKVKDFR